MTSRSGKLRTASIHGETSRRSPPVRSRLTRRKRRWIGLVSEALVRGRVQFETAFSALLQAAVLELGLVPAEWEVDLLPLAGDPRERLEEHLDVAELERVVRLPNPSRMFDDDREAMRKLAAVREGRTLEAGKERGLGLRQPQLTRIRGRSRRGIRRPHRVLAVRRSHAGEVLNKADESHRDVQHLLLRRGPDERHRHGARSRSNDAQGGARRRVRPLTLEDEAG